MVLLKQLPLSGRWTKTHNFIPRHRSFGRVEQRGFGGSKKGNVTQPRVQGHSGRWLRSRSLGTDSGMEACVGQVSRGVVLGTAHVRKGGKQTWLGERPQPNPQGALGLGRPALSRVRQGSWAFIAQPLAVGSPGRGITRGAARAPAPGNWGMSTLVLRGALGGSSQHPP